MTHKSPLLTYVTLLVLEVLAKTNACLFPRNLLSLLCLLRPSPYGTGLAQRLPGVCDSNGLLHLLLSVEKGDVDWVI